MIIDGKGTQERKISYVAGWNVNGHIIDNSMVVPLLSKNREKYLPYDPTTPLQGIYLEKTIPHKDIWFPMFNCSAIYNSQDIETS